MIHLIDSTKDSLTVTWKAIPNAKRYVLQYRKNQSSDEFLLLSDKLQSTQARKKNLEDPQSIGFIFRVAAILSDNTSSNNDEEYSDYLNWVSHEEPFHLLSKSDDESRITEPTVTISGNHAVLVRWNNNFSGEDYGYQLQMRENNCGVPWETIAPCLMRNEVRKKNLTSALGYQFRVKPVQKEQKESDLPYSKPSAVSIALGLSKGMKNLFNSLNNDQLLKNTSTKISVEEALGGREFVLLYCSAHWCGPCRQFTPQLANWYRSMMSMNANVEVVFLSADHDEHSFKSYYATMPWLAVDFEDDTREKLMSYIRVQGIPRLVVLDGKTGRTIVDNAVGQQLNINQWRTLASSR